MKTWRIEVIVVVIVLLIQLYFTHFKLNEIICSLAVLLTFCHAQIADRLQEQQEILTHKVVECYWKLKYYFIAKECLWIAFFILTHSYSAISGAILFSLYPIYRKIYRKYRPIKIK